MFANTVGSGSEVYSILFDTHICILVICSCYAIMTYRSSYLHLRPDPHLGLSYPSLTMPGLMSVDTCMLKHSNTLGNKVPHLVSCEKAVASSQGPRQNHTHKDQFICGPAPYTIATACFACLHFDNFIPYLSLPAAAVLQCLWQTHLLFASWEFRLFNLFRIWGASGYHSEREQENGVGGLLTPMPHSLFARGFYQSTLEGSFLCICSVSFFDTKSGHRRIPRAVCLGGGLGLCLRRRRVWPVYRQPGVGGR